MKIEIIISFHLCKHLFISLVINFDMLAAVPNYDIVPSLCNSSFGSEHNLAYFS